MKCPRCGGSTTRVCDSRSAAGVKYRRRLCPSCDFRFSTTEMHGRHLPERLPLLPDYSVRKRSGRCEEFDREKLRRSLKYAARRATPAPEVIESCVNRICERLYQHEEATVDSVQIIKWVLDTLVRKDAQLAWRYAGMYLEDREFARRMLAMDRSRK